jgi:NADH-quinone oxidoreductase subunit A
MEAYIPILIFAVVAFGFPIVVIGVVTPLIRAFKSDPVKLEPYECGIEVTKDAFDYRFSVRYYLIAVLFVVFDVETIFLFPWAINHIGLGWFGFVEMAVFIAILFVAYWYAFRRKALDWA